MFKVVHFELPADDLARAVKFYKKAFGWNLTKFPMEGMEYWGVHTGEVDEKGMPKEKGFINGGLVKRGGLATQAPTLALMVPSLTSALKKAEKAGATVVMPKVDLGMGLYAKVKDSEGNVIGLWQDKTQAKQKASANRRSKM